MKNLLVGPILIPLLFAALCLGFRARSSIQRMLFCIGTWLHLGLTTVLIERVLRGPAVRMQLGGWPAPFAIELSVDRATAAFLLPTSIVAAVIGSHVLSEDRNALDRRGRLCILLFLLGGASGVFLAADMFNLFVWFELTMLCSFVLLSLGGHRNQLEGALKYVVLNLVASTLFLCALGYLYGSFGSLSMRQIAAITHSPQGLSSTSVLATLFAVSFSIKAALFPLSSWLPASYHTSEATTQAFMASVLTKLGVYSLMRLFVEVFPLDPFNRGLGLTMAAGSVIFGGFGALVQDNLRRLISFVVVSQVGILVIGVMISNEFSLTGTLYLAVNEMTSLAGLILLAGRLERIFGSAKLSQMGGLYTSHPAESALLGFFMLNLAGIPPLAGFIGKATLLQAGLGPAAMLVVLLGSFLTLAAFARVWVKVVWRPLPEGGRVHKLPAQSSYAWLVLTGVALTLFAAPILDECRIAGAEMVRMAGMQKR